MDEISRLKQEHRAGVVELMRIGCDLLEAGPTLSKPLLGGVFGAAGYRLASQSWVVGGLDEVRYFVVVDPLSVPIASGSTKAEAISQARYLLKKSWLGPAFVAEAVARVASELEAERALKRASAADSDPDDFARPPAADRAGRRSLPRKRRRMFEAAGGRCFYCQCELEMHGNWHIDHKLPRALGGDNDPGNLVVACVACNLAKSDKTDVEYLALLANRPEPG